MRQRSAITHTSFLRRYRFSTDHKVIGRQYFFLSLSTTRFDIPDIRDISRTLIKRPIRSLALYNIRDYLKPIFKTSRDSRITIEIDEVLASILINVKDFTLRYNPLPLK